MDFSTHHIFFLYFAISNFFLKTVLKNGRPKAYCMINRKCLAKTTITIIINRSEQGSFEISWHHKEIVFLFGSNVHKLHNRCYFKYSTAEAAPTRKSQTTLRAWLCSHNIVTNDLFYRICGSILMRKLVDEVFPVATFTTTDMTTVISKHFRTPIFMDSFA